MQVTVNGKQMDLPEGATVTDLIEGLGLAKSICAAEVNHKLVPQSQRKQQVLSPGDTVEIVTLVGGG